jgi:hypothetical protein
MVSAAVVRVSRSRATVAAAALVGRGASPWRSGGHGRDGRLAARHDGGGIQRGLRRLVASPAVD